MEVHPVGFELFSVDGQTDGIHMTKPIFTFFSLQMCFEG